MVFGSECKGYADSSCSGGAYTESNHANGDAYRQDVQSRENRNGYCGRGSACYSCRRVD